MKCVRRPGGRDRLVAALNFDQLATLLAEQYRPGEAVRLLGALDGSRPGLTESIQRLDIAATPFGSALPGWSPTEIGACLASARSCDPGLETYLFEAAGGPTAMIDRIQSSDPWITELDILTVDSSAIGRLRFRHLSDEIQGDPQTQAVERARLLLRCFPGIDRTNVQAVLPGGHPVVIDGTNFGSSELQREYDHTDERIAWNQAMIRLCQSLLGQPDTVRLSIAFPMIEEAMSLNEFVGRLLLRRTVYRSEVDDASDRMTRLHELATSLPPRHTTGPALDLSPDSAPLEAHDRLSGVFTTLTGNVWNRLSDRKAHRAIASVLRDQVLKAITAAKDEPWGYIGQEDAVASLDRLRRSVRDLSTVLFHLAGDADDGIALRAARSGSKIGSLRRAAEACEKSNRRRTHAERQNLEKELRTLVAGTHVVARHDALHSNLAHVGITVDLESLTNWFDCLEPMISRLADEDGLTRYLLLPMRRGMAVPAYALSILGDSVYPLGDLSEWPGVPPPTLPLPTFEWFDKYLEAVLLVAGTCTLSSVQRDHADVQAVIHTAEDRLTGSLLELASLPAGPVGAAISEHVEALRRRLDQEMHGQQAATMAEEFIRFSLNNDMTEEMAAHAVVRLLVAEFDIDPEAAAALLS